MRALKFIGLFFLLLAVVVVVLAFLSPGKIDVRRSVVITAPQALVSEQMFNFRNWEHWNPFYEQDSTLKIAYTQEKGFEWESRDEIKKGSVMAEETVDNQLEYKVVFAREGPGTLFAGGGKGYMKVEDVGGGKVKATWQYQQQVPFPANAMILLWNNNNTLGQHFEHGLKVLKMYVESGAALVTSPPGVSNSYDISETSLQPKTYVVVRKTVAHKDLIDFFSNSYAQLEQDHGPMISGSRIGIFYKWDIENKKTDLAAGFPVSEKQKGKKNYADVAASPAYMTVHKGGYGSSAGAHEALAKYMKTAGKVPALVIEEYVTGPFNEPDSLEWVTNIYYLMPDTAKKD